MRHWTILIFLLAGCAIGQREVKYSEMGSEPKLKWDGQELIIKTENSKENSALSIYDIQSTIDNENNSILLRGLQAVGKEYKTEFKIKIKDVPVDKHDTYKIFWIDPDGKRTELQIGQE